ncbi:hypothetical protein E1B28_005619 [Marasmius oreades]|uniref:Uncharacterized protein n=1 Tax=Marasmius oreades TaxID=181124 RepID=A0A9P7UV08_9AGAR|nr:uncharacterized protein E1B28_005619 [Marasmius oreades]KAG7094805.1 hypothetical protein E1B28_005619 [Marasmius oreades]
MKISRTSFKRQLRLKYPPIYLFIRPRSLSSLKYGPDDAFSHIWSFNKAGQSLIPNSLCESLGLPTRFSNETKSSTGMEKHIETPINGKFHEDSTPRAQILLTFSDILSLKSTSYRAAPKKTNTICLWFPKNCK